MIIFKKKIREKHNLTLDMNFTPASVKPGPGLLACLKTFWIGKNFFEEFSIMTFLEY